MESLIVLEWYIKKQMKKQTIINATSKHFTAVWIKNQKNPKLEGFKDTAEQCRRDQNSWIWGRIIGGIFILMTLVLFVLNFTGQEKSSYFWVPGLIGVLVLFGKKFLKLGENQKALLKDWKPIRRRLLKQRVFKRCYVFLKQDKVDYIGDNEIRNLLVKVFDSLMNSLYSDLRKAEQEGFYKKEEKLGDQMSDLAKLAYQMGLSMSFDKYFESFLNPPELKLLIESIRATQ